MVSGGSVGPEGEGDPAVAVERDEAVVAPAPARELVVGYALTSKKAKSFLQPKLRGLARQCRNQQVTVQNWSHMITEIMPSAFALYPFFSKSRLCYLHSNKNGGPKVREFGKYDCTRVIAPWPCGIEHVPTDT